MLKHLPQNTLAYLHALFQKCWTSGEMPNIWKHSIVIPIHKQGKPKSDKNSYRPIALTSHVCKLMEKVVLNRLDHYCEKEGVIPKNQAGFRKGRSTIEHLVKLTTQVKQQFARRKNIIATFFDVKKAYDQVWHYKLLQKLKTHNKTGGMFDYIKTFLSNRHIQVRVGNTYSEPRDLHMGLPQGSVISPILFNILIADLPNSLSKDAILAQYADDICMWMRVTMKRTTSKRTLNHIKRLYQNELNKINTFMVDNGLTLSLEKTNILLFDSGSNAIDLPVFTLNKARKSLNVLKIISKQNGAKTQKLSYILLNLLFVQGSPMHKKCSLVHLNIC